MKSFKTPIDAIKNFGKMSSSRSLAIIEKAIVKKEWLYLTNLDASVKIKHGFPLVDSDYSIEVSEIMSFIKSETVASVDIEGGFITTSAGRKVAISTKEADTIDFPKMVFGIEDLPSDRKAFSLEVGNLVSEDADLINYCLKAIVSKNEMTPALQAVCLNAGQIIATDAHKMVRKDVMGSIGGKNIQLPAIAKVLRSVIAGSLTVVGFFRNDDSTKALDLQRKDFIKEKDLNEVKLFKSAYNILTDEDGDLVISTPHCGDRYPNYAEVYPKADNSNITCSVSLKDFKEKIKLLLTAANKTTNVVVLDFEKNKISASDIDMNTSIVLDMPQYLSEPIYKKEALVIGFNGKFMLALLDAYKEDEFVLMNFFEPLRAMLVNGSLIMPIKVSNY